VEGRFKVSWLAANFFSSSMLDPADESLGIHLEHIVHLPDTLRRKCLLVHMVECPAGLGLLV
jgi:hypothetical protein